MAGARPKTLLALAGCLGAVAAIGAFPAAAVAASCPNANLTPQPGNVGQVRAAVLCLINQERERHGEGALAPNAKLTRAAQGHSRDMAEADYFAHVAPNGETPLDRMRSSGYLANSQVGYVVGENIAWGTLWLATPQSIVAAWMASPGHRANILDASFREAGVGVAPHPPAALADGQAGAIYTQDFGAVVTAVHSSRRSAARPGRITSGLRKSERSNTNHGSSRRQGRDRHRLGARHRTRHRRAARRARRAGAHQRPRRRHRKAGR